MFAILIVVILIIFLRKFTFSNLQTDTFKFPPILETHNVKDM